MTKALAILGIVGVALAALFSFAVSGDLVPIVVLLFLVTCGIMLFTRRSGLTTILGIVLILLGLSALLYYNPISGKNGTYLPQLPAYFHGAFMPTLVILGCVAVLLALRDDVEPAWTGYLGLAAAAVAILMVAFVADTQFGNFSNPLGIGVAILVLLLLIPLIALLRGPPATVAPTTTRSTTASNTRVARK